MKKILLIFAAAGLLLSSVASCDSEPKNPGDFSVKSELYLSDFISLKTGDTYPLTIAQEYDSIYQRKVGYRDTIYGPDGEISEIKSDTVIIPSSYTARILKADTIFLLDYLQDTIHVDITSNARWNVPVPNAASTWYKSLENTTGGGDSYTVFSVLPNVTTKRTARIVFYTNDSTVMYIIPLTQKGFRDR